MKTWLNREIEPETYKKVQIKKQTENEILAKIGKIDHIQESLVATK